MRIEQGLQETDKGLEYWVEWKEREKTKKALVSSAEHLGSIVGDHSCRNKYLCGFSPVVSAVWVLK